MDMERTNERTNELKAGLTDLWRQLVDGMQTGLLTKKNSSKLTVPAMPTIWEISNSLSQFYLTHTRSLTHTHTLTLTHSLLTSHLSPLTTLSPHTSRHDTDTDTD